MELVLGGYEETSMSAYPGKNAAVVYLGGCNLRCRYCYHHLILDQAGCERVDTKEIVRKVLDEGELVDSVVFSGGEPTQQPQQLYARRRFSRN